MDISKLFEQTTSINADYFLISVLKVLGRYNEDYDDFGKSNFTKFFAIDMKSEEKMVYGSIEMYETSMLIRRL